MLPNCSACSVPFLVRGFAPCSCPTAVDGGHVYFWCRRCRDFTYEPPCQDDGDTKEYGRR